MRNPVLLAGLNEDIYTGGAMLVDNQKEKYRRICDFVIPSMEDRDAFISRLCRENGWLDSYALRVIDEYKRFLFLALLEPKMVSPSRHVDRAWHLHLLFTRSYWESFCGKLLQEPIHHQPSTVVNESKYAKTLELYNSTYGETPPKDIWPDWNHMQSVMGVDRIVDGSVAFIVRREYVERLPILMWAIRFFNRNHTARSNSCA